MILGALIGFAAGAVAGTAVHEQARQRTRDTVQAQFAAILSQPGIEGDRPRIVAARDAILAELEPFAAFTGPRALTQGNRP